MSTIVSCHRKIWVDARYRETVELFHEYRRLPENEHRDLVELARACAAMVMAVNSGSIIGNRERTARDFMTKVRENIEDEIYNAIMEEEVIELVC